MANILGIVHALAGCGLGMLGAIRLTRPALGAVASVVLSAPLIILLAHADTLDGSLVLAYLNNPTLNSQRASMRATDEGVPQALSGYRPRVTFNGAVGSQYNDTLTRSATLGGTYSHLTGTMTPSNFALSRLPEKFRYFGPAASRLSIGPV